MNLFKRKPMTPPIPSEAAVDAAMTKIIKIAEPDPVKEETVPVVDKTPDEFEQLGQALNTINENILLTNDMTAELVEKHKEPFDKKQKDAIREIVSEMLKDQKGDK